ncbi:hypothetical protein H5J25_01210 [Sphingomonas aliaeris]|uniref:Uncharacterized protein n=1 Tax=Sphingomonas aliaeris TaxID=2759526 RepID=A0A974NV07_9SPHN|nr:hypothetical protein [Sphingomonas aliaeris]QQV77474.1 hypothetical protein H5J25_01210 [Sphingomonas aliaeris]
MPLAWSFGLERAVWLVAALLPPLMIWGVFRAAKAVYGEVPPTAIATLPFALAYPYQYGMVNFWLAGALSFHAFAWWVRLQDRNVLRSVLFVPIGFAIWVCHVYGWAILGILVEGYEVSRAFRDRDAGYVRALATPVVRSSPLIAVMVVLVFSRTGNLGAETVGWFRILWKLENGFHTLQDQWMPLDIASVVAALGLIAFGLYKGRAGMDSRFGMAAMLFAVALVVIPYQLFGSGYADARIFPFLFIAAILSVRLPVDFACARVTRIVPIAFALLFALRMMVSAVGYLEYQTAYSRHLLPVSHIERGARIAVLVGIPCLPANWRMSRIEHLPSLALVRRDAFINTQWSIPGGQLLHAEHAAGTTFNGDPAQYVTDPECTGLGPVLAKRIAQLPRCDFDYLWLFHFAPQSRPRHSGLVPIYRDEATILYRLMDENKPLKEATGSALGS